ncbi:MAG TPA: hypothetical protein PLB51_02165 [Candidatus Paceibacterota bacterium]|nr:hypothetical protein [Candidatus Paceibacterota bacterium]
MKSAIVPIEITHLDVKPVANKPLETICLGHGVEVDRTLMRHFGKLAQAKSKDLKADEPHSYPIATITSLRPSWKPAELLTTIRDMEMKGGCLFGLVNVLHALVLADREDWWSLFTPMVALGTTAEDGIGMRIFPALIRKENKIVIGGVHDSALPGFKNFLLRPRQEPEIKMFRVAA